MQLFWRRLNLTDREILMNNFPNICNNSQKPICIVSYSGIRLSCLVYIESSVCLVNFSADVYVPGLDLDILCNSLWKVNDQK